MPTPVRVRGRAGNKASIERLKARKKHKHEQAASAESDGKQAPRMSRLESLPNELLQDIFLLSLNFDLPLASRQLHNSLTSDVVKRKLVLHAFRPPVDYSSHTPPLSSCSSSSSSSLLKTDDAVREKEQPSRQLEERLRLQKEALKQEFEAFNSIDASYEDAQRGYLQSRLAACKWFTPQFFQKCRREYLLAAAKFLIQEHMIGSSRKKIQEGVEDFEKWLVGAEEKQEELFRRYKNPGTYAEPRRYDNGGSGGGSLLADTKQQRLQCKFEITHEHDKNRCLQICLRHRIYTQQWYEIVVQLQNPVLNYQMAYTLPHMAITVVIPNKLLRGPWSVEKFECLLHFFNHRLHKGCDDRCQRSNTNFDRAAAAEGLNDAIAENFLPAVARLTRLIRQREYYMEFAYPLPDEKLEALFGEGILHLAGYYSDGLPTREFSLTVTGAHLSAALDSAKKHNDIEATIYRWLVIVELQQSAYGFGSPDREGWHKAQELKVEEQMSGIENGIGARALKFYDEWHLEVKNWKERGFDYA
jgi:hypothetical protein